MSEDLEGTTASEPAAGSAFLSASDLLMLLLDDDEGRASVGVRDTIDPALAGAVPAELSLAGLADTTESDRTFRSTHVTVENAESVTDPVLLHALAVSPSRAIRPRA